MVGQNYKNVCAFLCYRDKEFTTEEVAEFLTRHTIEEIDGIRTSLEILKALMTSSYLPYSSQSLSYQENKVGAITP